MDQVWIYLQLGFKHILDLEGYDHMLFLLALCSRYTFTRWKEVFLLATAFTIGHSITLALCVLDIFSVNTGVVEWLIPVTIAITALVEAFTTDREQYKWKYLVTLLFGTIHGMGFSGFLKSLYGSDRNVTVPLLSFNLGLEVGQLLFVVLLLAVTTAVVKAGLSGRKWHLLLSGLTLAMGVWMSIDRWPF